jgi:hypothetical protein
VVNVICQRTYEAFSQWAEDTFDRVASAYQTLLNAHRLERETRNQQLSGVADLIGPPELNQARAVHELRRLVIQDLMGTAFTGENDIVTDQATGEPSVSLTQTFEDAQTVEFFEQAFEWENLVYICYPYYWARQSEWVNLATGASADPEFDRFVNAGAARVVVPARPGFENLVNFFLYTGMIWGGSRPPAPDDPDYLSVAQEIQSLEIGATDGVATGPSWEIALPTTLLWAGTDETTLPQNPAPTIPPPGAN